MRLNDRNYLGRYQVGQEVPLGIFCRDRDRVPSVPDSPPVAKLLNSVGTILESHVLPVVDPYGQTGWFAKLVRLGAGFALGSYTVSFNYTVQGYQGLLLATFEVVGGGDLGGPVISLYSVDRPEARYIVAQLGTGRLVQGRNPTV